MSGWIKLHRSVLNHWIWSNSDYVKAWITILLTVNHENAKILIHGELIDCNRGQSILSLQSWVKIFGRKWTIQRVRTFFELLKNDSMIDTEGLRKTTRLTVCNYDYYQDEQQANNTQRTRKQQADNTQITTNNKNNKNNKNNITNWKNDFQIYLAECKEAFRKYYTDDKFIKTQQALNPELNVKLSMSKAYENYWSTTDGWDNKRKSKTLVINWKSTIARSIPLQMNRVYYTKQELFEINNR